MPTWPASLPQVPESSSYEETAPNELLRTQMDSGPAKVRRRFTSGVRDYGMTFRMTKAQVATLDTFYITTLSGGVVKYDWTNPRTGATDTFRFKSPPKYQHRTGDFWRVAIEIEQLP